MPNDGINSIANFYNNLFSIEIAVFGIIAAIIFVLLQIVYSHFSYREIKRIFKNPILIPGLALSIATLIFTAIGSFRLSFPQMNPWLFQNVTISFLIIAMFASAVILFLIFAFSNISGLSPSKIALLFTKQTGMDQIRKFVLHKYGVPSFNDFHTILNLTKRMSLENRTKLSIEGFKDQIKQNMDSGELHIIEEIIEDTKKEVGDAHNPFEPINALMIRSINSMDITTIDEILSHLSEISIKFLNKTKNGKGKWDPILELRRKYLDYFISIVKLYSVACDRQMLEPIKIKVLDTSGIIANKAIEDYESLDLNPILAFWKKEADKSIGEATETFNKVIQLYRALLDRLFENSLENNQNMVEEIFRHLGWLFERLIDRKGIEEKPLVHDYEYSNEYDQIIEAILSYSYKYEDKYPDSSPQVYFDIVQLAIEKIIPIQLKDNKLELKSTIFGLLYIFYKFCKAALLKKNSRGAALAVVRLKKCYINLLSNGLEEIAKETIGLFVVIAGIAFSNRESLDRIEFLSKPIEEYTMDILTSSKFRDEVASEVRDSYTRQQIKREFVHELGKRLNTNFGFMFDYTTGENYPKDDPRRQS